MVRYVVSDWSQVKTNDSMAINRWKTNPAEYVCTRRDNWPLRGLKRANFTLLTLRISAMTERHAEITVNTRLNMSTSVDAREGPLGGGAVPVVIVGVCVACWCV